MPRVVTTLSCALESDYYLDSREDTLARQLPNDDMPSGLRDVEEVELPCANPQTAE